jgi:hypothetical protein
MEADILTFEPPLATCMRMSEKQGHQATLITVESLGANQPKAPLTFEGNWEGSYPMMLTWYVLIALKYYYIIVKP